MSPAVTSPRELVARLQRLAAAEVMLALAAAGLAELLACVVLEIWRAQLDVPLTYSWDANFYGMVVKGLLDHGWHYRNPSLGAPFGQQLYDFPIVSGDNLQVLLVRLLGFASSDWATVMNVYFLLTFPLAAATAYLVFRRLGATPAPSIICSSLFALLPYHFARGENQLFFSGYFAVPLGAYLVLAVIANDPLFTRRTNNKRRTPFAFTSRQSFVSVALCAVVALASGAGYFALFTILLVAAGMMVALLARRGKRVLLTGSVVIAVIGGVLVANLSPAFLYRAKHGTNQAVGKRSVKESEIQALKLTELVLPIEHHRVARLARLSEEYAAFERSLNEPRPRPLQRPLEADAVHLGLVATLGFAFLLVLAVVAGTAGRPWIFSSRYRDAAAASLVAFLIGTVGGISALIAGAVSPQFRSWNRISIFIAFFALLAIALCLSELGRHWRAPRGRRLAFASILAITLGVGVLDQTSAADIPQYRSVIESYRSDGEFVRAIERRLRGHGSVFQLPYVPFPEGGLVHRLTDYDLVRGYLQSNRLQWSFGAMNGRPEDWQGVLTGLPVVLQLYGVAAAGFDGVYLDRFGYSDSAKSLERQIQSLADARLESRDKRLVFFDLRGLRRRLVRSHTSAQLEALRRATLEPLRIEWLTGFGPVQWNRERPWRPTRSAAVLAIVNPSQRSRRAFFEAVLATRRAAATMATIDYPGQSAARARASTSGTTVRRILELAPGRNVIRVAVPEPAASPSGPAPLWMVAAVLDEGFGPFKPKQGT
jgi:phosphoglycerol transferase